MRIFNEFRNLREILFFVSNERFLYLTLFKFSLNQNLLKIEIDLKEFETKRLFVAFSLISSIKISRREKY